MAGAVMNVLVPYMVNPDEWGWGLKTDWFYAGLGFLFTTAMWFLVLETAGCVSRVVQRESWANIRLGALRRSLMSCLNRRLDRGGS